MRKSAIGIVFLVVLTLCGRGAAQDFASTLKSADAAYAERDYSTARGLYERAIREGAQLDSDLAHARNLATVYLNSNPQESAKAIQWLQAVVRLDPQADGMRLQLCKLLLNSGDTGGAVQNYRQLVERHPGASDYVLALASALRQDGKSDAALRLLKDTVDKYPNLNVVRVEYARGLNFVREFSEARRQFQKVLANDPNDLIAQVGMAKSMSYDGDQEGALVEYDRILRAHPGLYDAMIGKAFALLWSGHVDEARELLQRGLARHPDDREVRDALNSLPKGNGSAASVATPVAAPSAPEPKMATAPAETHPPVFATAMEPRTITPPKSERSHSKNHKAASVPESAPVVREAEQATEPKPASSSSTSTQILYAVLVVMGALLVFAGMKLRSLQQARKAEQIAAERARRDEFVASAVSMNGAAAMIVAGSSRRMSDVFTPIATAQKEPVVIEYTPKVVEPEEEVPLMSAEMSTVMDAPRVPEPKRAEELPLMSEIAKPAAAEVPKKAEVQPVSETRVANPVPVETTFAREVTPGTKVIVERPVPAAEVMIVGGLPSVVQLQCRWLSSHISDVKPLLERDWATAAGRIVTNPPAVIVLNSGSDDRWTSMRMLAWIVENHPELRQRVIAITTADHYPSSCDDLVVCEPIDSREWSEKLSTALAASRGEINVPMNEGGRMRAGAYSVRQ